MQSHYEIPDTFWSLFRSVNREIYIESLLCINQEYEYSNYFLTREVCLQILNDRNTQKRIRLEREESETELDLLETTSSRILNWLVKTGWRFLLRHLRSCLRRSWKRRIFIFRMSMLRCIHFRIIRKST